MLFPRDGNELRFLLRFIESELIDIKKFTLDRGSAKSMQTDKLSRVLACVNIVMSVACRRYVSVRVKELSRGGCGTC